MSKFNLYYQLTKPGIIYGNVFNTAAGFLLASNGDVDFGLMAATLFGTGLVIASACVVNNYIDRNIDAKMERTKRRGLATGDISVAGAFVYAAILGLLGAALLAVFVNWLTFAIGVLAYISYVVAYGVAKRKSVHGTLVGTIPGSLPPVAGYVAVTGQLDLTCLAIFLILASWQMAHFYSIAVYRLKDYKAAGLPVSSVVRGVKRTKNQIIAYIVAFIILCPGLTLLGKTGYTYLIVMLAVGLLWFNRARDGINTQNDVLWAKSTFKFSLIVILTLSVMMSVGPVLP